MSHYIHIIKITELPMSLDNPRGAAAGIMTRKFQSAKTCQGYFSAQIIKHVVIGTYYAGFTYISSLRILPPRIIQASYLVVDQFLP